MALRKPVAAETFQLAECLVGKLPVVVARDQLFLERRHAARELERRHGAAKLVGLAWREAV